MSRTVCPWCKAPLVLKDDILVCSNTDCPACDEKYLHEELIRTRKALEVAKNAINSAADHNIINCVARGIDPRTDDVSVTLCNALEQITALEQKE